MDAPRTTVRLHAAPRAASARTGDLAQVLGERIEAAYERGLADGRSAALASGAAALEAALERLDAAAECARDELAQQSVELAVSIARELVGVRVEAGEMDLERIVRGALADSEVGRGDVVVHLNPEDLAALAGVSFRAGTRLEPDPALARGDVHLSTPRGLLVRELDAALLSIREQLLEELA